MKSGLIMIAAACLLAVFAPLARPQEQAPAGFAFPDLPYTYYALEPWIDARTMEIHYSRHHRGYYDNFIKAIAGTDYERQTMPQIFAGISKAPAAVRNMGGGYYNHNLFWENLAPTPEAPSDVLRGALEARFGSMEAFQAAFNQAAAAVFGSGWAWLVLTSDGKLEITATANQDNPLMDVAAVRGAPLLALDVWEHAYYLKHQNKRADYIAAFWKVVNWPEVSRRYTVALDAGKK